MRYIPELDGLRALAVVSVLLFHVDPAGPVRGGFIGVDLFFVLSGFLITSILVTERERTGTLDLRRFYWRRFLRLMPALLLFLTSYAAVAPFIWPGWNHSWDALLALLYVSDYSYPLTGDPQFIQHSWSLGVEEKFYLLWPAVLLAVLKARSPLPWLLAAWALATVWRASFDDWQVYYYRFDTRASGLIFGAALYFLLPHLDPRPRLAVLASLALAATCLFGIASRASTFITLAEVASAALVACAVTGQLGWLSGALRAPPVVLVGKLSYGIYLWNFPIALAVRDSLPYLPAVIVTLAAAIALAAVSYLSVEAVARRYKDRLPVAGMA